MFRFSCLGLLSHRLDPGDLENYVCCNGLAPFVQLGLKLFLKSTKQSSSNVTPSMLWGEVHLLPVSSSTQFRWAKRGGELCLLVHVS